MPIITFTKAINAALREEMESDESVIILGEEMNHSGGRFGVTKDLLKKFGNKRVYNMPINEEIMVGIGIGAALAGLRPIIELMYSNFLTIAFDDIYRSGLWRYLHGGKPKIPMVIRLPIYGYSGAGAEIASPLISSVLRIPGIKIIAPSTPYDAKGLLKSAIRDNNPVLFFEHVGLYKKEGVVPAKEYALPLGKAILRNKGSDVTIIAASLMTDFSVKAAKAIEKEGIGADVLDLASLVPLDDKAIFRSAKKTKRVIIVEEDIERGGIAAEIGAKISENCRNIRIKRVAAKNVPLPAGNFQNYILPSVQDIVDAVYDILN